MLSRGLFILLIISLMPAVAPPNDLDKKRKIDAKHISAELNRLGLRRHYITDFMDPSGERTATSTYYAAVFSRVLINRIKGVTFVSRADVHKFLNLYGWTDKDLAASDVLPMFKSKFAPDSILEGLIERKGKTFHIEVVARDLSAKELFRYGYEELADLSDAGFVPAPTNASGRIFYFAGLDGVSSPKCIFCDNPPYSEHARKDKISGTFLVSATVTTAGNLENFVILQKLDPDLDHNSLVALNKWRLIPAKDPDGVSIPTRLPFQVIFS